MAPMVSASPPREIAFLIVSLVSVPSKKQMMDSGTVPWQDPSKVYVFLISESFLSRSYPHSFVI